MVESAINSENSYVEDVTTECKYIECVLLKKMLAINRIKNGVDSENDKDYIFKLQ